MKNYIVCFLSIILLWNGVTTAQTAKTVTDLPDVSVIGNFLNTSSSSKKSFDVKEIELTFQHYLYPSVSAWVTTAFHKGDDGKTEFELEEAYVNFADLTSVLLPELNLDLGIGAIVGKKLLNIGKTNPLHPEQWAFVDRSIVIEQFFGKEEGLAGEGAQASYLLPISFFSQVEVGYWAASAHAQEGEEEESHGVEYSNKLLTTRLWNGFDLSDTQSFEIGANFLRGNATASSKDDQQDVMGFDLTYLQDLGKNQSLKLQAEYYQATYGEEGEARADQTGGYLSAFYKMNKHYQAGLRYATLGKHGDEGNVQNQWSAILTRQLTETSKLRIQYNTGENVEDTVYLQMLFGIGPHSHVLQ